jgi:Na+-transporting methylmalonyl-CoA/oxaloacetate decarboxylase gamma subunit
MNHTTALLIIMGIALVIAIVILLIEHRRLVKSARPNWEDEVRQPRDGDVETIRKEDNQ